MIALIDGDSIPYIVAYFLKDLDYSPENKEIAKMSVRSVFSTTIDNISCTEYIGVIGSRKIKNFRYDLFSEYKANRQAKPEWIDVWKDFICDFLIEEFNFIELNLNIETDDAISILANRFKKQGIDYTVVSQDKDLLQIEGLNYNPKTKKLLKIEEIGNLSLSSGKSKKLHGTGYLWVSSQTILGDPVDNIPGISGKGPVFAFNSLKELTDKQQIDTALEEIFTQFSTLENLKLMKDLCHLLQEDERLPEITPISLASEYSLLEFPEAPLN